MTKILITGASGFIGGFLVKEALKRGYETWAGIRSTSNKENLQDPKIHFIDLKYSNPEALTQQLKEFVKENGPWNFIVHNAGITKTTHKDLFFKINAENTHHLIESLAKANCIPEKFLLMSSLSSFGTGDENTFRPIALSDPQQPNTVYGKSKLKAENYLRQQEYFPYVIFRPTGVYGPGEKDYFMEIKSIQSGLDFAAGFIPQRITFIYVKDLAIAVFKALEKKEIMNKEYFIADGDVYTDKEFAKLIQDILQKKRILHARIPMGIVHLACICSEWIGKMLKKSMTLNSDKYIILKQRNWICETSPLQKELDFHPIYNLREGLTEAITWYKEKGWL